MPLIPFDVWTLAQARKALGRLLTDALRDNRLFYHGDHWQDGRGWPVPLGTITNAPEAAGSLKAGLQRAFTSENMIASSIETQLGAILGREPARDAVTGLPLPEVRPDTPQEQMEAEEKRVQEAREQILAVGRQLDREVGEWWRKRKIVDLLEDAGEKLLYDSGHDETGKDAHCVVRLYIPSGLMVSTGRMIEQTDGTLVEAPPELPKTPTLAEALDLIFVEVLEPEDALVTRDKSTEREVGVYLYAESGATGGRKNFIELSYLVDGPARDRPLTRLRVLDNTKEEKFVDYDMRGYLWHHQLRRSVFITEQVRQLQRALNLTLTVLGRNQYSAGFPMTILLDALPPGANMVQNKETGVWELKTESGQYSIGPGMLQFLFPSVNYEGMNDEGLNPGPKFRYGSPSVWQSKPVEVTSFRDARDIQKDAFLGEVDQKHTLITGDATASGKSRIQAHADFLRSVGDTKGQIDGLAEYILNAVMALAIDLTESNDLRTRYADWHFEASCVLDLGPIDADMLRALKELVDSGFLSHEMGLALSRLVEDVEGEKARIREERADSLSDMERRVEIAERLDKLANPALLAALGLPKLAKALEAQNGNDAGFVAQ